MSKKCAVRSLSDSSLAELANLIVSTLGYAKYAPDVHLDIDVVMVEINQYLELAGATSNIYQDLLRVILSSDYLDASMRFTCLQMLLNCGVSFLATEIFPFSYYERILQVIAAQGAGLRVLNLKGVWIKEEHMHYLYDILKKCPSLNKLFVPHIANDDLLEMISRYSRHLQILDVSGETDITEIGIEFLSHGICCDRLTVVDVGVPGEENICCSDIALLLEHCPNLETLSTYSFVGPALKFIYDNVDENFTCKLKYLHDTGTNEDVLNIIKKTCPNLLSLYLDSPKRGSLHVLGNIYLQKLKLTKFVCAELMQTLQQSGHTLTHLTVIRGSGDFELCKLAHLCPMLSNLDCYVMDEISYINNRYCFQHLEGLEILSSAMTNTSLKTFICSVRQLKRLAVDSISFTDEDIFSIFTENDFNELEDIWFTLAPNLTIQSIELLLDRCPELQSIGQLTGWSLTVDDFALIKGLLKSGNSSLQLQ